MELYPHEDDGDVVAAIVNHRLVSLSARIQRSGIVEPVSIHSRYGVRLYRRHLTMMLYASFYENYPGAHIKIGQAISEGYYFEISGVEIDDQVVQTLTRGMEELTLQKKPFLYYRVPVEEARRLFARKGASTKRSILDRWPSAHVGIMGLGDFVDFCLGPVAPHTGYFNEFKLFTHDEDLILQFPNLGGADTVRIEGPQPKLYELHKQSRKWSQRLGISHVGELNTACIDGSIKEVIKVSEGLHEKRISSIADEISQNRKSKLVFVAGPSSAGKTTFAKRLSIQLKVAGINPTALSLDNYYVDRVKTPRDSSGNYDFEALEAIDLDRFNNDLRKILDSQEVRTPVYNFHTGTREKESKWIPIKLKEDDVLIIEGIHGLNDALTPAIPDDEKYKIYINALNPLAVDEHNRLHTSDTRLIRRIVRDRHYRGYLAAKTIQTWPSVRRGERAHIFPFQESANTIFDTSLIYEFSVLKIFADRYLLEVPRTHSAFAEAYRLRKFLSMFIPVLPGDVPQTSLMREFIGGSNFSY